MKSTLSKIVKDIRFWLLLFLLLRLYGITQPPLEVVHNWRQSTVVMVARNFYELDNDIRFPRLDTAGEKSGIAGMEFPLLNFLHYLMALIFGWGHWYGRLINLVVTTLGVYCFYKLVRRFFDEKVAFPAAMILLVSIWFYYGRKIMPDTFAASLSLAGIYFGFLYFYDIREKRKTLFSALYLVLFMFFSTAGMLSKIPVAALFPVFLLVFADRRVVLQRKIIFLFAAVVCIVPVLYWYFYWAPYLNRTFGYSVFFMGLPLHAGVSDLLKYAGKIAGQFYNAPLKYLGFGAFLFGFFMMFKAREKRLTGLFFLVFTAFLIVVIKGGENFARHSYYIIPFVPVMALVAGFGLSKLPWKNAIPIILILICSENIANQYWDFKTPAKNRQLLNLEASCDKFSDRKDLVAVNSVEVPTPVYFAHRKGWVASNAELQDPGIRKQIKDKGCKLIIILKKTFGKLLVLPLKPLEDNDDWTIYSLSSEP
jgi:hypothetical protein